MERERRGERGCDEEVSGDEGVVGWEGDCCGAGDGDVVFDESGEL